jgi:hypothetical protein
VQVPLIFTIGGIFLWYLRSDGRSDRGLLWQTKGRSSD